MNMPIRSCLIGMVLSIKFSRCGYEHLAGASALPMVYGSTRLELEPRLCQKNEKFFLGSTAWYRYRALLPDKFAILSAMQQTAFSILKNPDYRRWFFGQAAFLLGNKAQGVAVTWLAYSLTNSLAILGMVAMLTMLPYLVLGPIGGWLADRFDERKLVMLTQGLFSLLALGMAALTASGHMTITLLLPCALGIGLISALDAGPRPALVQRIVGDRALMPKAVALNAIAFHVSRFAGPALAGMVLALANEWVCFLLNGLASLPLIFILARMRPLPEVRGAHQPGLLQGFIYAWGHTETRTLLTAFFCVGLLSSPYILLLPYFAKEVFAGDAAYYGFLFAASGLGSLAASLTIALRRPVQDLPRVSLIAFGIAALLIAAFASTNKIALALPLLSAAGFGITYGAISLHTRIQLTVPLAVRGRVLALLSMVGIGTMPLGTLVIASVADTFGTQMAVAAGAVTTFLAMLWLRQRQQRIAI